MNNKRMPKQIVTAKLEGKGKRGRKQKRLNYGIEEDLKTTGRRNYHAVARNRKIWKWIVLEAKVNNIVVSEKNVSFSK
jgi:hypothetical protein